mmetsp:Transcript_90777/g.293050  ORF Transcript_90777/g.293050 Transcript_90777/m.293050 type:complete len:536 (-) Transcript_90777:1037-2644(-)
MQMLLQNLQAFVRGAAGPGQLALEVGEAALEVRLIDGHLHRLPECLGRGRPRRRELGAQAGDVEGQFGDGALQLLEARGLPGLEGRQMLAEGADLSLQLGGGAAVVDRRRGALLLPQLADTPPHLVEVRAKHRQRDVHLRGLALELRAQPCAGAAGVAALAQARDLPSQAGQLFPQRPHGGGLRLALAEALKLSLQPHHRLVELHSDASSIRASRLGAADLLQELLTQRRQRRPQLLRWSQHQRNRVLPALQPRELALQHRLQRIQLHRQHLHLGLDAAAIGHRRGGGRCLLVLATQLRQCLLRGAHLSLQKADLLRECILPRAECRKCVLLAPHVRQLALTKLRHPTRSIPARSIPMSILSRVTGHPRCSGLVVPLELRQRLPQRAELGLDLLGGALGRQPSLLLELGHLLSDCVQLNLQGLADCRNRGHNRRLPRFEFQGLHVRPQFLQRGVGRRQGSHLPRLDPRGLHFRPQLLERGVDLGRHWRRRRRLRLRLGLQRLHLHPQQFQLGLQARTSAGRRALLLGTEFRKRLF